MALGGVIGRIGPEITPEWDCGAGAVATGAAEEGLGSSGFTTSAFAAGASAFAVSGPIAAFAAFGVVDFVSAAAFGAAFAGLAAGFTASVESVFGFAADVTFGIAFGSGLGTDFACKAGSAWPGLAFAVAAGFFSAGFAASAFALEPAFSSTLMKIPVKDAQEYRSWFTETPYITKSGSGHATGGFMLGQDSAIKGLPCLACPSTHPRHPAAFPCG